MAKFYPNTLTRELRGRLDGYVVRRFHGQAVLQARPKRRMPWSRPQKQGRRNFGAGARYAAMVRDTPALLEAYRKLAALRKRNYWQMAIRDYMQPPTSVRLRWQRYEPRTGGELSILADDDAMIAAVKVVVRDAHGAVLAHGDARFDNPDWRFRLAPVAAGESPAANVVITAFDRPGNFIIGTFALA